jgi:hypothetical protein
MVLTEKMLEKFAGSIVDRYFSEKVALNDGVTEIAQSQNLNDEQIKRLVEAVNTTAFLKKFNNPDPGADGRVVEFETANPNAVINRMLDTAKAMLNSGNCGCGSVDTETDISQDLPVTRADEAPAPPAEEGPPKLGEPRIRGHIVIMRLRKTAEALKEAEYQARNDFTDATQQLVDRFRRLNSTSFEEFEKDAFYQLGPPAAPFLQLVRRSLNKGSADYDYTDMRKYARIVDTDTKEMHLLREMMKASAAARDCQKGREKVGEHLARIA